MVTVERNRSSRRQHQITITSTFATGGPARRSAGPSQQDTHSNSQALSTTTQSRPARSLLEVTPPTVDRSRKEARGRGVGRPCFWACGGVGSVDSAQRDSESRVERE
jgi:hypothetical protein